MVSSNTSLRELLIATLNIGLQSFWLKQPKQETQEDHAAEKKRLTIKYKIQGIKGKIT